MKILRQYTEQNNVGHAYISGSHGHARGIDDLDRLEMAAHDFNDIARILRFSQIHGWRIDLDVIDDDLAVLPHIVQIAQGIELLEGNEDVDVPFLGNR